MDRSGSMQQMATENRRGHAEMPGGRDYDPAEHAVDKLLPGARAAVMLCLMLMAVLVMM